MKKMTVILMLVAMIAAACSSSESSDETTTTQAGGGEATTSTAASTTEAPSTTEAAQDTTTTTAATQDEPAGLVECVVGEWEMDTDAFFEVVMEEGSADGLDGEFAFVDGAYLLIITPDGNFQSIRDNWTFAVTSDFGDLQMTINDVDDGTWSLDGAVLSTVVLPGDPPEIEILVDGEPFTFPGGVTPFEPPAAEFTGATVECEGDTLFASAEGFTSVWARQG